MLLISQYGFPHHSQIPRNENELHSINGAPKIDDWTGNICKSSTLSIKINLRWKNRAVSTFRLGWSVPSRPGRRGQRRPGKVAQQIQSAGRGLGQSQEVQRSRGSASWGEPGRALGFYSPSIKLPR